MRRAVRRAAGVLLALAVTLGIAALSRVPYTSANGEAVLRLSWRARSERVQSCRKLTEEEMAALPIHMRRTEECEGRVLPYHLRVEVDGRPLVSDTIHPAGAREDRPLYVYQEIPLPPGPHHLSARFIREDAGSDHECCEEERSATPTRLELSESLGLRPGHVALVTYDPDLRSLVVRTPGPPATPR